MLENKILFEYLPTDTDSYILSEYSPYDEISNKSVELLVFVQYLQLLQSRTSKEFVQLLERMMLFQIQSSEPTILADFTILFCKKV